MISMRWRRIVVGTDVPLNDAMSSLMTIALIFGLLAVGSLYNLFLVLNHGNSEVV
jgi:hypothetical protein